MTSLSLLNRFREEKKNKLKGGIYHITQIKLCYNSNRIEGSRLSEDQTRYILETNTFLPEKDKVIHLDDIIETVNHFKCFDYMLETADLKLNEKMIKQFHKIFKNDTSDSQKDYFNIGEYKLLEKLLAVQKQANRKMLSKK